MRRWHASGGLLGNTEEAADEVGPLVGDTLLEQLLDNGEHDEELCPPYPRGQADDSADDNPDSPLRRLADGSKAFKHKQGEQTEEASPWLLLV